MNINPDSAKEIPCKNVLIYGYCKYENKGCAFSHPSNQPSNNSKNPAQKGQLTQSGPTTSTSQLDSPPTTILRPNAINSEPKRKFNMNTPLFQPSVQSITNKFSKLSPKLKEIPTFVPTNSENTFGGNTAAKEQQQPPVFASRKFNASTPSFTPSNPFDGPDQFNGASEDAYATPDGGSHNNVLSIHSKSQNVAQPTTAKQQNPYLQHAGVIGAPGVGQMASVQDFMFLHGLGSLSYPLNHHLYAPAPPPRFQLQLTQHETTANSMFIPNDLRELLTKKNEATLQTVSQLSLPEHVGVYHSLVPIDQTFEQISKLYQLPCHMYKVNLNIDGMPYAMRRIDYSSRMRILNEIPFGTVKKWKSLRNPNVVQLRDAFTSVGFMTQGEPVLCLIYDYYPLASTLQEQHITRKLGAKLEPVTENLLWTYLVQLVNALLAIHKLGLNAGSSISMSKVLVTSKNRVRLGAVCVDDILEYEGIEQRREELGPEAVLKALQLADVIRLGRVMTELAGATLPVSLRSGGAENTLSALRQTSSIQFSEELLLALEELNGAQGDFELEEFFVQFLARRSLNLINGLQDLTDHYESQLLSEVENARLFRLLAKINYVVDRWPQESELSGSFLVIKLFRDFVFQTYDEFGKPIADLSKVLTNLNKLDVGVDEKILLVSREEDSCIIVSYKEVKDIIDLTFRALFR